MATPRKTKSNPYGLTQKQQLVINEAIDTVKKGRKLNLSKITAKYYNTKNSAIVAHQNFKKINYRGALLSGLTNAKIIGKDSKSEQRLIEGLDATDNRGSTDYRTRLAYIQELNKITGVYAPQRSNQSRFNLNVDVSEEQMGERIEMLHSQLSDTT